MTLCFRVANVDMEKFRANRDKITPLYQKLQKEGKIRNPREDVLMFFHPVKNVVHFNTTRVIKLNPVDPSTSPRPKWKPANKCWKCSRCSKTTSPALKTRISP